MDVRVLKNANQEIFRRVFTLTGEPPAGTAMHEMLTN
jgi:hypothetical protein